MPVSLLTSQLATLEPLAADEPGARLDAGRPLADVLHDACATLATLTGTLPTSTTGHP
jgi:gluconokinase